MQLENKVSIITGGARGIGKAIAKAFAREGSHIVLCSRTKAELEQTKLEINRSHDSQVEIFSADVSKSDQVTKLIEFTLNKFKTINILVNCAGIQTPIGTVADVDSQEWLDTMNINLNGTFYCIKAVLPTMISNKEGKIINFSGGGAVSPRSRFSAYSTSKAAVVKLTECLAGELDQYNIDVNSIAPGAINTRLLDQVLKIGVEAAGVTEYNKALAQQKNGGVSPAIATELAVFLASPKSRGLSGKLISAVWDKWKDFETNISDIMASDLYSVRRIIPGDKL